MQGLVDQFRQFRKQFWQPITATLTVDGASVLGNGQTVQFTSDVFHVNNIYPYAIDNAGVRLVPAATFDQVTVEIVDANSRYSYTNGAVDLMTFYDMGRNNYWAGWWFYPQQQINVTFVWNVIGAGISDQPISAGIVLGGERYSGSDFPELVSAVRQISSGG